MVLPMVQEILAQAGVVLTQCDAIAFGAGPGSFTGVRTACGVAQGLAFGVDVPAIPISTLHTMACAAWEKIHSSYDVLTLLDARMGEVYWAQYRYHEGWQEVIEPTLTAPAAVTPQGDVVVVGNGWTVYSSSLTFQNQVQVSNSEIMPHAQYVAQLAEDVWKQGKGVAARDAQPFYLRHKVALTRLERQQAAQVVGV